MIRSELCFDGRFFCRRAGGDWVAVRASCVVFLLLLDFRLDADADAGTLEDSSEGRDDELCCDIAGPLRGPRRGSVGAAI